MPEYILLLKADRDGSVGLVSSGSESEARFGAAVSALGGTVISYLAVTGAYDLVVHVSFDDEVATLLTSHVWTAAGMYTEVLRAFTVEELDRASEMRHLLTALLPDAEQTDGVEQSAPSSEAKANRGESAQ